VGLNAVNDGIYLECAIYLILKNHFKGKSYYTDLLELFHEVMVTYPDSLTSLPHNWQNHKFNP
jgi:farnesyl diphosphate synthase